MFMHLADAFKATYTHIPGRPPVTHTNGGSLTTALSRQGIPVKLKVFNKRHQVQYRTGTVNSVPVLNSVANLATQSLYSASIQTALVTLLKKRLATNLGTFSGVIGDFWRLVLVLLNEQPPSCSQQEMLALPHPDYR